MRKHTFFILLIFVLVNKTAHAFSPANSPNQFPSIPPLVNFWSDKSLQEDTTLLNKPAPEFKLYDLDGKVCDLESLKGKIIVLNFWFVACKPCVNEMPALNAIKKKYAPEKVVFLALALDKKAAIDAFLKEHKFDYTILPDAASVAENYGLFAYPASMVVDAKGIIRFVQVGGPNIDKNLPDAINVVLANNGLSRH